MEFPDVSAASGSREGLLQWYAIYVRSNFERIVAIALQGKGYEAFLPTYLAANTPRRKQRYLPLFPGYVFCRLNPLRRLAVLTSPGVVHIVGNSAGPLPIPDTEIAAIQRVVHSKLPYEPCSMPAPGERVVIQDGPLTGIQGVVLAHRQTRRLVISVALLGRAVAVDIDGDGVKRTGTHPDEAGVPESTPRFATVAHQA